MLYASIVTTTKKTKLSRRPLQRIIKLQVELGPYSTALRDGKERAACRYVLWISDVPKTRKRKARRFMAVVQQVCRPGNLGDQVHNVHLFEKVVVLPDNQDAELVAKGCYRQAQKAMYFLVKDLLAKATRPLVRSCADEIISGEMEADFEPYWHTFDVGNAEATLGEYREVVMSALGGKYLGHWEQDAATRPTD